MKYASETEFGIQVVEILHKLGFETWQEVYMGLKHHLSTPCCDVIAKRDNLYYAFELKRQFNDQVLEQAKSHLYYVDYSYVIVPSRTKKSISHVKQFYAQHFGIGVIFADPSKLLKKIDSLIKDVLSDSVKMFGWQGPNAFKMPCSAKKSERKQYKQGEYKGVSHIERFLFEEQKESTAGTANGGKSTPFKRSCAKICEYLQQHPEATKREVWNALRPELHWSSYSSMSSSFRTYGNQLEVMKKIIWKK